MIATLTPKERDALRVAVPILLRVDGWFVVAKAIERILDPPARTSEPDPFRDPAFLAWLRLVLPSEGCTLAYFADVWSKIPEDVRRRVRVTVEEG